MQKDRHIDGHARAPCGSEPQAIVARLPHRNPRRRPRGRSPQDEAGARCRAAAWPSRYGAVTKKAQSGCASVVTMSRCPHRRPGMTSGSSRRSDGSTTSRSRSQRCGGGSAREPRSSGCRDRATCTSGESSSVSANVPRSCARSGTRPSPDLSTRMAPDPVELALRRQDVIARDRLRPGRPTPDC